MRFWKWLLPSCVVFVLALRLSACPAGYESPESLVRHARLIVQVEVLSVEPAPLPAEAQARSGEGGYGRLAGKARVRVAQVIKGKCATQEFTLISGPHHTCAPYLMYHAFTVGKKPVLILDTPLPAGVKAVAVTWRNRLVDKSVDEVKQLMELARVNWRRAVERHRRVVPEAMAQAEKQHAEWAEDPGRSLPAKMPYEVMACLMVLLNDPDHLAPVEMNEAREVGLGYPNAFLAEFYQKQGVHISSYGSQPVLPSGMREFFPADNSFDYRPPAEAGLFNRKMLHSILVDELRVPGALAASTLADPKVRAMCAEPQIRITWMTLRPGRLYDAPLTETAVYYLMLLADPEPDGLVWGTYGMDMSSGKDRPFLPPDLFVGFLGNHNDRLPYEHGAAPMILTCLPHPQIAPLVRAYAARGDYDKYPGVLIRYFVCLGSGPDVLNAVGIMEKEVEKFAQSVAKAEMDSSVVGAYLEHYRDEIAAAFGLLGTADEFKPVKVRLNELARRLDLVRTPESSAAPAR